LGLALTACGGGGGGDAGTSTPPPNSGATGVNGTLSGTVLYREGSSVVLLDLFNGSRASLQQTLDFYPALNSQEYAAIDSSTRASTGKDKLILMNLLTGANNTASPVLLNQAVSGTARLSPDRQSVAAMWQDVAGGETSARLTVFSRTGTIQARLTGVSAYTWLPNGQLLTAQGSQLVATTATGTQPSVLATLQGTAIDLAVSPDGTRIAAALPAGNASHVWIMDNAGGNQRQLTTSSTNERNPEFSPNGAWLLVRQDTGASCPKLYAVSTSASSTQTLSGSSTSTVQRIAYKDSAGATVNACAAAQPAWVN
jgi:Tol biopolymer transport system component